MSQTKVNLGRVPKERGEYSATAKYYKDNIVEYGGSAYIASPTSSVNDGNDGTTDNPEYYLKNRVPFVTDPNTANAGWRIFASGRHVFSTGEDISSVGIDEEPTAGSRDLVESGGVIGDVMPVLNRTFNVLAKEAGKYVKRDGTIGTASSNISVSDYIEIEGGNNFKVLSGVKMPGSTSYCAICFFSDFNTPCGYYATTANTELINVEITVPADAKYARFNLVDINTVGIIEYKGSVIKNVNKLVIDVESLQQTTETQQSSIDTIEDFIESEKQYYSKELLVPSKEDGLLQASTGDVVYNAYVKNYGVSDYIDVSGYGKVKIISGAYQGGNSSYAYAAAYDENKTFISPAYVNTQKNTEITNQEIVLPTNAAFLRVTLIDKTSTTKIEEPGKIDIIDEKLQNVDGRLQDISQNIIPFKNKGKSVYLFGGSHTVFAQSEVAKDMWRNSLMMTVKSCGCGSTAIVAGLTLRGWVNDGTYYYTRNSYPQVWDDYGFLIEGVTAPTSQDVDSITLSNGLVCVRATEKDYFQNNQIKLLRLIEKNVPAADIYIFQCSSNDYATNYSLGTYTDYTAVDSYDTSKIYTDSEHRGTVCGGFNRCIKAIREENPAAEIYVFTDYRIFDRGRTGYDPYTNEYPSGMNKNYYEFQQEICKAAKVAGCAVLDQFMLQGVDEYNYTAFYLADNLHLNEDGYRKIGYLQVDFLSNGK